MAKKKKGKRHRHPVAPPVHSAPAAVQYTGPAGPRTTEPPPARPMGAEPPSSDPVTAAPNRTEAPRRVRQTPAQLRNIQKRKARRRNWIIAGAIVVLLIGGLFAQRMSSSRATASFNRLAKAAGSDGVRSTSNKGAQQHLAEGETTKYDTSPPTHGKHSPSVLPAGVYTDALSDDPGVDTNIYRAVHALEHGAVIVWYDGLSKDQVNTLEKRYRDERKVIVVPYPQLEGKTHVALTAWGRLADCEKVSTKFIDAFIERYRESSNAPEPQGTM